MINWLWRVLGLESRVLYEHDESLHKLTTGRSVKCDEALPDNWTNGSGRGK